MKIQVFLITPPDWSHNSNLILGVIFPPKNGVRFKRYQLLQSFKPNCELQLSTTRVPNGRSRCARNPIFLTPASHQDDGSMDKPNSLKLYYISILFIISLYYHIIILVIIWGSLALTHVRNLGSRMRRIGLGPAEKKVGSGSSASLRPALL